MIATVPRTTTALDHFDVNGLSVFAGMMPYQQVDPTVLYVAKRQLVAAERRELLDRMAERSVWGFRGEITFKRITEIEVRDE